MSFEGQPLRSFRIDLMDLSSLMCRISSWSRISFRNVLSNEVTLSHVTSCLTNAQKLMSQCFYVTPAIQKKKKKNSNLWKLWGWYESSFLLLIFVIIIIQRKISKIHWNHWVWYKLTGMFCLSINPSMHLSIYLSVHQKTHIWMEVVNVLTPPAHQSVSVTFKITNMYVY